MEPKLSKPYIPINCSQSWDSMQGDEKVRFCGKCSKNVFNLTKMSYDEQIAIFPKGASASMPCVRAYVRADHTIVFDRCPVAFRPMRDKLKWLCASVMMVVSANCQTVYAQVTGDRTENKSTRSVPSETIRVGSLESPTDFTPVAQHYRKREASYRASKKSAGDDWQLSIYGPITWVDRSGQQHEAEYSDKDWKAWLDRLGQQIIDQWVKKRTVAQDIVNFEVCFRAPNPRCNLTFVPDKKDPASPMKQIIENVTGGDKQIPFAKILPATAKDAESVSFGLRMMREWTKPPQ
jgi:hypothetical protein